MAETAHPTKRQAFKPDGPHVFPHGGTWLKWYVKNRYDLTDAYCEEALEPGHGELRIRERFERAVEQAKTWMLVRLVITILLAFGVVTTVTSLLFRYVPALAEIAGPVQGMLNMLAAWAGSASGLLIVARVLVNRGLVRYDVATMFLGGRLTPTARRIA